MKSNNLHFYSCPNLSDAQFVHGEQVNHRFPRHLHRSALFGLIERGARVIEIEGERFTIRAGECFLLDPDAPHACPSAADMTHDYWVLALHPGTLQRLCADMTGRPLPHFRTGAIADPELVRIFREVIEAILSDVPLIHQETLILDLVAHCLTQHTEGHPPFRRITSAHESVQRVRAYLNEHFEQNLCLHDLSDVAHISPFHLNRLFRQEVGVPPCEYLGLIRVKRAQALLQQGKSIASVAYSAGFADQSHLTRFFKRHVGITPGDYRRKYWRKAAGNSDAIA